MRLGRPVVRDFFVRRWWEAAWEAEAEENARKDREEIDRLSAVANRILQLHGTPIDEKPAPSAEAVLGK